MEYGCVFIRIKTNVPTYKFKNFLNLYEFNQVPTN